MEKEKLRQKTDEIMKIVEALIPVSLPRTLQEDSDINSNYSGTVFYDD